MISNHRPRARNWDDTPLFWFGMCGCDHVLLVVEDGEPCPQCIESNEPHDCPLLIDVTIEDFA